MNATKIDFRDALYPWQRQWITSNPFGRLLFSFCKPLRQIIIPLGHEVEVHRNCCNILRSQRDDLERQVNELQRGRDNRLIKTKRDMGLMIADYQAIIHKLQAENKDLKHLNKTLNGNVKSLRNECRMKTDSRDYWRKRAEDAEEILKRYDLDRKMTCDTPPQDHTPTAPDEQTETTTEAPVTHE